MSPKHMAAAICVDTQAHGLPRLWVFAGPAMMVSVGYMDPGNWATDLEGGTRFGYHLLWVLLLSNVIALLLQSLCARLGVIGGCDLAQACRTHYTPRVRSGLWLLAELAIVACDLAEVLGSAIALNLLFGLPLLWGALVTILDVLLILLLQRSGIRKLEAIIVAFVLIIGVCFVLELVLAQPDWAAAAGGFVPRLDGASLYIAIGILGATVMPHNLYLHSALVQTRQIAPTQAAKRQALRYSFLETALALNGAFCINAAILVLSAAVFFRRGLGVHDLREAYQFLTPLLGTHWAACAFALALLCAGQSSTITGTLAGQVVMEGFVHLRLTPALRRLLTRGLAVLPALTVLALVGDSGVLPLLVASQVVLSLQLPFAIVPLIRFTSHKPLMGAFTNSRAVRGCAWISAACITALNSWLIMQTIAGWHNAGALLSVVILIALGCGAFLVWITLVPLGRSNHR